MPQTQLPDDLLLLTDKMTHGRLAGVPRAAARPRTGRARGARCRRSIKIAGGELKHVMKSALAPMLPDEILHRKQARLRRADGRLAEEGTGAACSSTLLSPRGRASARPVRTRAGRAA